MNVTLHQRVIQRLLGLFTILALLLPGAARAAFTLAGQATTTATLSTLVKAELTIKSKGASILYDASQNMVLLRGNSQVDLGLTYSPLPAQFNYPGSVVENKGIFLAPFGPFGGTNIGADSMSYTFMSGGQYFYGQVHYALFDSKHIGWGGGDLTPWIKVATPSLLVQTRNADGTIQPWNGKENWSSFDQLLPGGSEVANVTFNMHVETTDKGHPGGPNPGDVYVPAAGVEARVVYTNGAWTLGPAGYDCTVWFATPWAKTDAKGNATTKLGSGKDVMAINGWHHPAQLFLNITAAGYAGKQMILEDMGSFNGKLDVQVNDADGNPLPGAALSYWGGLVPLNGPVNAGTDAKGKAELIVPWNGSGTERQPVEVALNPLVTMTQYQTQVLDFPGAWVDTLPAYLSPQIDLSQNAATYKTGSTNNLILRVKDSHGTVQREFTGMTVKQPKAWSTLELSRGANRLYYPYHPPLDSDSYTIEAVFKNKEPEVEEDEQVVGSALFPVLQTHAPALDRPFNFQFVAVSASAPVVPPGTSLLTSRMSTADITRQMRWVQSVFPAPITYSIGPDQVASSWYSDSGRVRYYFYYLSQYKPRDVDLVVGVVAPGDLNTFLGGTAAGLSDPHYPFVVLIDPGTIPDQGVLHEFLHTRGLPDNYGPLGDTGPPPPADDGYNSDTLTPMLLFPSLKSYPQCQAVMFDHAKKPWLSSLEYTKLLQYATVPIARKPVTEPRVAASAGRKPSVNEGPRATTAALQKVMLIGAHFRWSGAPPGSPGTLYASNPTLISYDPVFTDWDDPYAPQPPLNTYYLSPGVRVGDVAGVYQDAWVTPIVARNVPQGQNFDPGDAANFNFKIPYRPEYAQLTYGAFNFNPVRKGLELQSAVLPFSANAPTATWLGPAAGTELKGKTTLSFQTADKDIGTAGISDMVYIWVKVSTDGGQTWRAAAPFYPASAGANTFTLDCSQFPSTTQCKFKILVSDGLRSTILEPATLYKLTGYAAEPKVAAEPVGYTVPVKSPASFTLPLRVANKGLAPLSVDIDPASLPSWLDKTMSRLQGQVVGSGAEFFPIFGKLNVAGKYTATLKIRTNDPKTPVLNYPVSITVGPAAPAPQVAFVESDPAAAPGGTIRPHGAVTFNAWELAGRTGLDARIHIEQTMPGLAVLVSEDAMDPGPNQGQYTYEWTPPAGAQGKSYAAEVTMTDPVTGLKDANGSNGAGWDVAFKIAGAANRGPVFTLPTTHTTILTGAIGKEIVLTYAVSDPDGDPLKLNLTTSIDGSQPHTGARWDQAAQTIRFTPATTNFYSAKTYTLTLTAEDPSGVPADRQWQISVPPLSNDAEHAWPSENDGMVIGGTSITLHAVNYKIAVPQKGCRFDWRLEGTATWNISPLLSYHSVAGFLWEVYYSWNIRGLTPGKTYEVRYVNVNPAGQDDPNPALLHFTMAANGGKVTRVEAPATVAAGQPFQIRVHVLNPSTFTWTKKQGYRVTSGAAADPFTGGQYLELGPMAQVAPGGTALYEVWGTAPATPGAYITKWQPYTDTLKAYGTAGQATVQVVSKPAIDCGGLRDYLLGKWNPSASWLSTADLDNDGKVTVADLLRLGDLLRKLN